MPKTQLQKNIISLVQNSLTLKPERKVWILQNLDKMSIAQLQNLAAALEIEKNEMATALQEQIKNYPARKTLALFKAFKSKTLKKIHDELNTHEVAQAETKLNQNF